MKKSSLFWILAVFLITAVYFTIYMTGQQNYRMGANDPQVQVSEDTAALYTGETDPESLVPAEKVNLANSLATFGIIYDNTGKVVASSADLAGKTPDLPTGALDKARLSGQNRITWQPEKGVRLAVVITKGEKGYVLIGRSLKEVERRITSLGYMVLAAWLGSLILVIAGWYGKMLLENKKPSK